MHVSPHELLQGLETAAAEQRQVLEAAQEQAAQLQHQLQDRDAAAIAEAAQLREHCTELEQHAAEAEGLLSDLEQRLAAQEAQAAAQVAELQQRLAAAQAEAAEQSGQQAAALQEQVKQLEASCNSLKVRLKASIAGSWSVIVGLASSCLSQK